MTLPHFLIIGGMKCGSTTLYRDLLTHPRVFFPIDKEPCNLCDDHVLTDAGRAEYEALFKRAKPDQLCAEASTDYTKLPDRKGVPERAREVLGDDLKLIYIVRDPIKRLISHHYHMYSSGEMPESIDEAVDRFPELVNYSRYAMQLRAWLGVFAPEQIRVVKFESYMSDRRGGCAGVQSFLGLDPMPELIETDKVHNKSEGKPVAKGPMGALIRSAPYRKLVRPLLPQSVRGRAQRVVLPKAPDRPDPPGEALLERLLGELAEDQARFSELMTSGVRLDGSESPASPDLQRS